ncbi:thermonuclease family protein [Tistrella mobilis]|uniref:Nuclease n=1 Tax=Tistrella mobilis (strain KA081020-065) TaxID=1110502 RepID=I3TIN0_TISMK|nr:thermonuclease family protein [Tistrella mobilis]AFK52618.1 putative nuclease [Tistrella mobilis KA081020-065]
MFPRLASAAAALLALLALPAQITPALAADVTGRASVIDGDTLDIHGTRIRMFGIDAPESSQICADAQNRAWRCGRDATQLLDRLTSGRTVACEIVDRDRYGRVVGRCAVNGEDINRRMVSEGLAVAYVNYGRDYVPAEAEAKAAKRGLWSGRFVMPWDHRKGVKLNPPPGALVPAKPERAPATPATGSGGHPKGCDIKGNISKDGRRLYHVPGSRSYERTRIDEGDGERWFCSEADARAAGWQRAGG